MYMGTIVLHVQGQPEAVGPALRRVLAEIDPNLTPSSIRSFDEQVRIQTSERTVIARLTDAFGLIALLLASVGLYAVTSHSVSQRTQEIGVRVALGGTAGDIRRLVFGQGMLPVGIGLVAGLGASLTVNRLLEASRVQVSPWDPVTLAVVAAVLILAALLGCFFPARRAMRVDPVVALRHD